MLRAGSYGPPSTCKNRNGCRPGTRNAPVALARAGTAEGLPSWGVRAAESDMPPAIGRGVGGAICHALRPRAAGIGTYAPHPGSARGGSGRVAFRRLAVVGLAPPVAGPFVDVSCHVQRAKWACSRGVTPHCVRVAHAVAARGAAVEVQQRAVRRRVAPGEGTRIAGTTRRLLPCRLRRQAFPGPGTVARGLEPVYPNDRVVSVCY
jgi:hypothetical protein